MVPKIEKARQVRASMALQAANPAPDVPEDNPTAGLKVNEDYGDTVPSKPQNIGPAATTVRNQAISDGATLPAGGYFGTFIVHDGDEIGTTATRTQLSSDKQSPPAFGLARSNSLSGTQANAADPNTLFGDSQASSPPTCGSSELDPKMSNISQTQALGDGSLWKQETMNKKSFALDKLWSIYKAGNTVPIPFLRATDISPIALLSDNVLCCTEQDGSGTIAVEALHDLFGDGQSKKGRRGQNEIPFPPSVYQRLTSSPTLLNLAQALAYHKMCYDEMPLQELQATQEQQTIQNLCDTLRTILRL